MASNWKDEIDDHLVQLHGTKLAGTVQYMKRLLTDTVSHIPPHVHIHLPCAPRPGIRMYIADTLSLWQMAPPCSLHHPPSPSAGEVYWFT